MDKVPKIPGEQIEEAVAKTVEALGVEFASGSSSFLGDVLGAAGWDSLREWRQRRRLQGIAKTAEKLKSLNVNFDKLEKVTEWEVYTIFNGFSDEPDDQVQQMWSNLLANRMINGEAKQVSRRLISVLKQLDGQDVAVLRLLDFLERREPKGDSFKRTKGDLLGPSIDGVTDEYKRFSEQSVALARDLVGIGKGNTIEVDAYNVIRLGLIAFADIDATPSEAQVAILNANPSIDVEPSIAFGAYFRTYEQNLSRHFQTALGVKEKMEPLFVISDGSEQFPSRVRCNARLTGIGRQLLDSCPN